MAKRKISNLDLKVKLTKEYLENGGVEKIFFKNLLEDLIKVKVDDKGKTDPDTVSTLVNSFMLAILGDHLTPPLFNPEFISEYISTLQKSNSFDQVNIDTEEHFDNVYEEFKEKRDMLFRGQREAKWRLYSKLQRQWINEKLFTKEETYQKLIENLVEIGKEDYGIQIKEILDANHIDTENSISILSYLQHHSCPTPLLDWTYKFQNALFFAMDELTPNPATMEIEDYFSVYYIEEKYFAGANLKNIIEEGLAQSEQSMLLKLIGKISKNEETKKKMEEHFAGRKLFDMTGISGSGLISHMTKIEILMTFRLGYFSDKDAESGIMFSLNNSKNILNQEGVFIWNADPSKPVEIVGDEEFYIDKQEEDGEKIYRFCSCYNIHKELSNYVRNRLNADGIIREFIYPTPEHNTSDVYEKSKMKHG